MQLHDLDYDDPSTGVMITYTGGDASSCPGGNERKLRLSFYCMNDPQSMPSSAAVVEFPACTYNIQLESMYGCPVSCGIPNNSLCGQRGVCGYDRDTETARCFCNEGYYGSGCESEGDERAILNDTSVLLLCICGFLVLVEIGV